MALWLFTTPVVREGPFAWDDLMVRYGMNRGVSVQEISPCQFELVRYDAYTNELGATNLPQNPNQNTDFWPAPQAGLKYFRGGYEHEVDDATKACLIASGIGITEDNFTLVSFGFGELGFGEHGFGGTP